MDNIIVRRLWDSIPEGYTAVNVTSRSRDGHMGLSPFYLGPVALYAGFSALNVENGWQYTKVYQEHVGEDGKPSEQYFEWAKKGWGKLWAERYPMGKGAKPLYSYWEGEQLSYVEARKRTYIPLYERCARSSEAFTRLILRVRLQREQICLLDFDVYDDTELSKEDIINNPNKKMGHAFVLKWMLQEVT